MPLQDASDPRSARQASSLRPGERLFDLARIGASGEVDDRSGRVRDRNPLENGCLVGRKGRRPMHPERGAGSESTPDGHVDPPTPGVARQQFPQDRGTPVAEHGRPLARQDSGHLPLVPATNGPDRIHPQVEPAETPLSDAIVDGVRGQTRVEQLRSRDHPVLPTGDGVDHPFGVSACGVRNHGPARVGVPRTDGARPSESGDLAASSGRPPPPGWRRLPVRSRPPSMTPLSALPERLFDNEVLISRSVSNHREILLSSRQACAIPVDVCRLIRDNSCLVDKRVAGRPCVSDRRPAR